MCMFNNFLPSIEYITSHSEYTAILWNTLITLFYKARQARHFLKHAKHANFLKHAKHAILWSTPNTRAHKTRQAREYVKYAKHANTQARHLADSQKTHLIQSLLN